ncbi:MAG: magnesium chelatase subunit D [Geminicoccaceae bacterium]|nr:MAG: magnesium chelatase subunit D [Geminicoccaceae bacterium]
MNDDRAPQLSPWADACVAAALVAVDPHGVGGALVRALPGPVRDRWLDLLRSLLPPALPLRRLPAHVTDDRLLGGLDLAATLQAGRPVAERGLLAEADGGIVLMAMAERATPSSIAHLGAALDRGEVILERDGLAMRLLARIGVVAFDEGVADDERAAPALADRLGFHLDLHRITVRDAIDLELDPETVAMARERLREVTLADDVIEALCGASLALGIASVRAAILALRVARAAAALDGREAVEAADAALAARLVLAPRATQLPFVESDEPPADDDTPDDPPDDQEGEEQEAQPEEVQRLEDMVLAAAAAAIPEGLLAMLRLESLRRSGRSAGTAGAFQASKLRGRPLGTRRGLPRAGARLNLVETLRAAAPWQPLRRQERPRPVQRVEVRQDDFRVTRFKQRTESTAIFAVDASGSSALHRLAEAKGAVELLLADCYVRRDRVSVLAFRGALAELVLPPTRSLARAKRTLGGIPGGGGTPIATAIDTARDLADQVRRAGQTPVVVLLTDGRANVARDGTGGRAQAHADAMRSARSIGETGIMCLVIDTSAKPEPKARELADAMGAHYLALPRADAAMLSAAVRSTGVLEGRR